MRVSIPLLNSAFICCLVTIAVQLICSVVPGWLVMEVETGNRNGSRFTRKDIYSVWYIIVCVHNSTHSRPCEAMRYSEIEKHFDERRFPHERRLGDTDSASLYIGDEHLKMSFGAIEAWKIQVGVGLGCALVAAYLLWRVVRRNNRPTSVEPSIAVVCVAALAVAVSCWMYVILVYRFAGLYNTLSSISPYSTTKTGIPFGLIMSVLNTLLTFITTVITAVVIYKGYRSNRRQMLDQCPAQAMPMLPMQVQGQGQVQQGYASPLTPQYIGYQAPQEKPEKEPDAG